MTRMSGLPGKKEQQDRRGPAAIVSFPPVSRPPTPILVRVSRTLREPRSAMMVLAVIGMALRLPLIFATDGVHWPDSALYYRTARWFYNHHDFAVHENFHTPAYPIFFSLFLNFTNGHTAARCLMCAQHLLGLASVLIWFVLLRKSFSPLIAFVGSLLAMCSPLLLYYECVLQTESLFCFSLSLALLSFAWAMEKEIGFRFGVSGLLFACATLVRPVAQMLPLALLPLIVYAGRTRDRRVVHSLVFVVCYAVALSPWMTENLRTQGYFGVSKGAGLNLYLRVVNLAGLRLEGTSRFPDVEFFYNRYADVPYQPYSAFPKYIEDRFHESRAQIDDHMLGFASEIVRRHPWPFLMSVVRDFWTIVFNPNRSISVCDDGAGPYLCAGGRTTLLRLGKFRAGSSSSHARLNRAVASMFHIRYPLFLVSMLALAGVVMKAHGAREGKKSSRVLFGVLLTCLLYFTFVSVLLNKPEDRFRLPIDPIFYSFAVLGAYAIGKKLLPKPSGEISIRG